MMKKQYECLQMGLELRKNLIELKQQLQNEESKRELLELLAGDYSLFMELLQNSEPRQAWAGRACSHIVSCL